MMQKWLGAALIVASCAGFGMAMASAYRREERYLGQLLMAFQCMQNELSCRYSALPMLLRNVAECSEGKLRQLFLVLADEIDLQICPDVAGCVETALQKVPNLPAGCVALVRQWGVTLGKFDLEGQLRELEGVSAVCRRKLQSLQNGAQERVRSFQTLGLCAGAALAILFI